VGQIELICNEVIRKRTGMLISNLERCKLPDVWVTTWDPAVWANRAREAFDLVLVDAPCSGQSLLAKGGEAEGCFHPKMVGMNASRQRRILANAAQCVAPGGHLLYMTCTFSPEENEKVILWFLKGHPDFQAEPVPRLAEFQTDRLEQAAYRLYPQMGWGAGAFTCLLKHSGALDMALPDLADLKPIWKSGDPPRKPRQSANPPTPSNVKLRGQRQKRSRFVR
jgi:16S rRNA C967 or C1407 C5-methylase (RsmB/RsmF family)